MTCIYRLNSKENTEKRIVFTIFVRRFRQWDYFYNYREEVLPHFIVIHF